MSIVAEEMAKAALENVQKVAQDAGTKGGFDVPGKGSSFEAKDLGKGEMGKPGSSFDGPWDTKDVSAETLHKPDVAASPELRTSVREYNSELAQSSAGGEYADVRAENLEKRSPENIGEARREFNQTKNDLIGQWEKEHDRPWPTYTEDVSTKDGKIIRKVGDRYDAHHVQPLELGGKNTVENLTPMHATDHYDKQGIHRPGGAYDAMVKTVKEA